MDRFKLHALLLLTIKVIPMFLALVALLNTILSYFNIDAPILSYLGGMSILPLLFLYLSSYALQFCSYHRMFLHYVTLNWGLNIYDYYIGIPLSDKEMLLMYLIITGIFLYIILWQHQREVKRR